MSPVSKKGEKRIVENCWQKLWGHVKHPEGRGIFPRIWKKLVSVLPVQLILITLSKMLRAGLLYETLRIPMIFCFLEVLWFVSQKASWVALETMSPYVSTSVNTYHWEVKRCPCSGQVRDNFPCTVEVCIIQFQGLLLLRMSSSLFCWKTIFLNDTQYIFYTLLY